MVLKEFRPEAPRKHRKRLARSFVLAKVNSPALKIQDLKREIYQVQVSEPMYGLIQNSLRYNLNIKKYNT